MTGGPGDIGSAYDASGIAWSGRPAAVYRRLAAALFDQVGPIGGRRVLDVGAGTGVAAEVARERGAEPVAVDLAAGMLAQRDLRIPGALADAARLPFADGSFGLVVLNFVLGHLPDPVAALAEARRVGDIVLASSFDATWSHPAKAIVDDVMGDTGFVVPDWYVAMKAGEDLVASPSGLIALANRAGLAEADVTLLEVDAGLDRPEDLVAWRWGMAHLAPYVTTLGPDRRQLAWEQCLAAVEGLDPVVVPMLALTAR